MQFEEMSHTELVELLTTIKENLEISEDGNDFCMWLAELIHVDISA